MFYTRNDAEVIFPGIFSEEGIRSWWYVLQQLHTHWFHVTYQEKHKSDERDELFSNLILISMNDHLIQFSDLPDFIIEQVYIVTPKHMNGTNHWKMEILKEIWEAEEPGSDGQIAHIFALNNDKKYVDSGLGTPAEELLNKKRIFSVA